MGFTFMNGESIDLFVKVNIASQVLNWTITLLYFSTSIANRMKASFKVETLLYNATQSLKNEYESYLHAAAAMANEQGSEDWKAEVEKFHKTTQYEISEFVKQDLNLDVFSMKE